MCEVKIVIGFLSKICYLSTFPSDMVICTYNSTQVTRNNIINSGIYLYDYFYPLRMSVWSCVWPKGRSEFLDYNQPSIA